MKYKVFNERTPEIGNLLRHVYIWISIVQSSSNITPKWTNQCPQGKAKRISLTCVFGYLSSYIKQICGLKRKKGAEGPFDHNKEGFK
ncbi:hypothetical protein CUMW_170720 [Citrus unshiu]|uniref:Uncharacterized protein n=1 Tax=Citrus unshiu TaxID=55188 RepID=A0A2H5PV90_CITUN|nr:hypothetical protein CUMW_170720 [Citrus unshiu]